MPQLGTAPRFPSRNWPMGARRRRPAEYVSSPHAGRAVVRAPLWPFRRVLPLRQTCQ